MFSWLMASSLKKQRRTDMAFSPSMKVASPFQRIISAFRVSLAECKTIVALLLSREGPDFRLALRVFQRPQLVGNAARNSNNLAGILEAGEIGTVAPCEGTAQTLARAERRVVHDVDQPLVVG